VGFLQTVWFLVFVAVLSAAILVFWTRVLSDFGSAITATFFSLVLTAAALAMFYELAVGRV
jgi:hypothetical protein